MIIDYLSFANFLLWTLRLNTEQNQRTALRYDCYIAFSSIIRSLKFSQSSGPSREPSNYHYEELQIESPQTRVVCFADGDEMSEEKQKSWRFSG